MFADRDRPGYRKTEKRRLSDLDFLAKLRSASDEEFEVIAMNHVGKKVPQWKKAAIACARRRRATSELRPERA